MWKSKWILFLFLIIVIEPTLCLAQGSLQRLEEFGSRSLIFDVPSVVHFDITIIQDSPKSGLSLRKVTGRFVQGERLGFRIDLKEMGDTESGVTGVPPVCFASKSIQDKQKAANLP
jgi:hypothetical protein